MDYSEEFSMSEKPTINGCNANYVKLVSSDNHKFYLPKDLVMASGTIKAMLSGPGTYNENECNVVHFKELPSHVLQKVCYYFLYKARYTNSASEIPEFKVEPEMSLELLMAANFLDC
uniref:Elongin-C n=1 Tax=Strongyloides stercoralis TaxID=6248 RepID=A0A0K0EJY0_STRER